MKNFFIKTSYLKKIIQFSFSSSIKNQVAVITGAGGGIGKACVRRFAQQGVKVVIADIQKELGEKTANQIRKECNTKDVIFQYTDLGNEQSIKDCMDTTYKTFGGINILVNNGTQFIYGHLANEFKDRGFWDKPISHEDWQKIWNVNIMGYVKCIEHSVPYIKKNPLTNYQLGDEQQNKRIINAGSRGSIINVSSVCGLVAVLGFLPYCTSKTAELQISRVCAMDLADYKIRVNAVSPGDIYTPAYEAEIQRQVRLGGNYDEIWKEICESMSLFNRLGASAEVANVVNFLASDESSFITGQNIVIDGGRTIHS